MSRPVSIAILFPRSWGRPRILRAINRLAIACPGVELTCVDGDTDQPCVDTVPIGGESVIGRILTAGG